MAADAEAVGDVPQVPNRLGLEAATTEDIDVLAASSVEFPAHLPDDVSEVAAPGTRGVDPNAVQVLAERLGGEQALAFLVPEGVDQRDPRDVLGTASSKAVHAAA